MPVAHVNIGSNLGDGRANVTHAADMIAARLGVDVRRAMADMETEFAKEVRGLFSRHLDLLNRICEIWYRNRESSHGNHIYKEITSMLGKMSHIKVAEELAEIINRHDNNWVDRFRQAYPGLGEAEYQLALYLYVGFRPSTIAVLADREHPGRTYRQV